MRDPYPQSSYEDDVGKLVRDKVLTKGFYWYDANMEQAPGFHQWLRDNTSLLKVRKSAAMADTNFTSVLTGGPNAHIWVLFEVLFPVIWLDQTKFGFPNTATKDTDVTVSSSLELEKDPLDKIADSVKEVLPFLAPVASGTLLLGGLGLALYLFRKDIFESGKRSIRKFRDSRSRGA